ncbi:hypothetical protein J5N97_025595 [Dioscorea zingiberensis]|uniref:1-aminocyclopropane-1-carboxylate oxidase n=1 Tax=Dioscorea zingiberensis TaxID=325984 RepID=A0A9D5H655_9LILI|nr:hypothetical protein J5N97_025595 [Dioscorea zingiberensis]
MGALHEACKKWGFFWVENHGVDNSLMEEVKKQVNVHYEDYMVKSFYNLDTVKELESCTSAALDGDWESSFFIWHQPNSNIDGIPNLKQEFREAMKGYIQQVIKLAETLAELMSENLGLDRGYLTKAFSEPCVGTKIAKYPKCPKPELVMGLRAHTDAGGIILLHQDDTVSGLEFFKDGEWVPIPPSRNGRIFVNLGDQLEVVSNGTYKSILHRVVADKDRSRLSIATFYNPGSNAIISPARKLMYPSHYRFQDYLNYYVTTKFSDKVSRFQTINEMSTGLPAIADK